VIEVERLSKDFGAVRALDALSFTVGKGALFGIVGPNGSGKSTLFDIIAGATRAQSGSMVLDGACIDGLWPHEVAARGVARTRQATRLFARMTALENVVAGAHLRSGDGFFGQLLFLPRARRSKASGVVAAREALALVGLGDRGNVQAAALREGERRRVGLARGQRHAGKVPHR
jgi:branched-chain amino acid transport system ATP-binding protein